MPFPRLIASARRLCSFGRAGRIAARRRRPAAGRGGAPPAAAVQSSRSSRSRSNRPRNSSPRSGRCARRRCSRRSKAWSRGSSSSPATASAPARRSCRSTPTSSRPHGARAPRPAAPAPRPTCSTGGSRSSGSSRCVEAGAISQQEFDTGAEHPAHGRSAARRARRAGPRRPGRAAVLPRRRRRRRASIGDIPVREGDRVTTSTVITTIDDNGAARGLHPGAARSVAGSAHRAAGAAARRRGQGRSPPTRSPSSRRASTTRRRRCWSRALLRERAAGDPRAAVRALAHHLASDARPDGADHRGRRASAASTSASSPSRRPSGLVARQRPVQVGELVGNDYIVTQRAQGRATS